MRITACAFALFFFFGVRVTAQEIGLDNAPPTASETPVVPKTTTATAPAIAAPVPAPAPDAPVSAPTPPPATKAAPQVAPKKETKLGQVSQIFRDKKRVVMSIDPSVADAEVPSSVVVQLPAGEACEGKVLQAQGGKALVDLAECPNFDKVKMSAIITPPLFVSAEPSTEAILIPKSAPTQPAATENSAPPTTEQSRRPKFSLSIGHHSGSEVKFNNASYSSGTVTSTGTHSVSVESAGQLTFAAIMSEEHQWGVFVGLTIEPKRQINSETISIDGGGTSTFNYTTDKATLQFALLEVNAIYRWSSFYLPFGLNYSLVTFTPSAASGSTITARGSIGAQLGVGFYATDQIRFEFLSQVISGNVTVTSPTISANLGAGMLSGIALRMGFDF